MSDLLSQDLRWNVDLEGMKRGDPAAWPRWRAAYLDASEVISVWRSVLAHPGRTLNVYLHVPYCQSSCRFCMYWSRATHDARRNEGATAYLVAQLSRFGVGHRVTHAYVGGGTPSYLGASDIERLLAAFERTFRVRHSFTMEANPLSLDEEKLEIMARHQVNRLSLGVQAFDAALLKRIGRVNGSPSRTAALVRRGRELGLEVNIDIMLGLPGQEGLLADEVRRALSLGAETVTVYRYQPTERLPEHDPVRYELLGNMWRDVLHAGYIPGVPRDAADYGAKLWQPRHRLRMLLRSLSREHGEYGCFSSPDAHLLGLGPGAWSHLHGYAWYREVTSLAALDQGPVYCGTRLSPQEERRSALRQRLHEGRPVRVLSLESELSKRGLRRGWLRRLGPWAWMKSPDVLGALMPFRAADASLGEPPLPVEPLLRFDGPSDLPPVVPMPTATSALPNWLAVVGAIPAAEVADAHLRAQIEPPPAPPLVVGVDHVARLGAAYARTERFALFYVGARELTEAEGAWLDALVERTRRAERDEATPS